MRLTYILLMASFMMMVSVLARAESLSANSFNRVAENALDHYIRPAFENLSRHSEILSLSLERYCETENSNDFTKASKAFSDVALSFARVDLLRFGPLIRDNRFERLYFWPDRKGLALKRIRKALLDQEPGVLDSANFKNKSVAIQGLGGLEYVMFGKGSDGLGGQPFRCAFAVAIAKNIQNTANEVLADWRDKTGYSRLLLSPDPSNAAYRSDSEVGNEIFNTIINGIEAIKRLKLGAIVGKEAERARPKRAQLWRSDLTLPMLIANLEALEDFTTRSGLITLLPRDQEWVAASISFEFKNTIARLKEIEAPISEAVVEPETRAKLLYVLTVMDNLKTLYLEEVAPHLGLRQGFNTLDGD